MAWFNYGKPEKRAWRKGVVVRWDSLSPTVLKSARRLMREGEEIDHVKVAEILPGNRVNLRFACRNPQTDWIKIAGVWYSRDTVFYILTEEDPEWVCDSDVGRGMVEMRRKGK